MTGSLAGGVDASTRAPLSSVQASRCRARGLMGELGPKLGVRRQGVLRSLPQSDWCHLAAGRIRPVSHGIDICAQVRCIRNCIKDVITRWVSRRAVPSPESGLLSHSARLRYAASAHLRLGSHLLLPSWLDILPTHRGDPLTQSWWLVGREASQHVSCESLEVV